MNTVLKVGLCAVVFSIASTSCGYEEKISQREYFETVKSNEICNDIDDDLDGLIDEGLFRPCRSACGVGQETCKNGQWGECNAPKPTPEICDGKDNDCDGTIDEDRTITYYQDLDGDGYGNPASESCTHPEWDCDDSIAYVHPGPVEVCDNGIDDDCDGLIDNEDPECAYPATANAKASVYGSVSVSSSGVFNELILLFVPAGLLFTLFRRIRARGSE